MSLSQSTYSRDTKVSRAEKEEFESNVRSEIEQIRVDLPGDGCRLLLLPVLKANGIVIGERKLRAILSKFELQIRPKRKFVKTTDSNHDFEVHPNLIEEMKLTNVNQVWEADITYIRIENGFVYLAALLNLFSRKVIGWQVSKRIGTELTLDALKMAIARRKPPRGVTHHSDRGVQYLCDDYTNCLLENDFFVSCSAKGNPLDNAWTE